ncbi:hypothetical protein HN358_05310 [Candidatus Uhrbacteria bacterium]|nr:hypothetical protein [Candidatus Uhrbacteria bacterium]MBT7716820.1 hypothetical protein [Candidatus Uhrbacteria bacterium]
MRQSVCIDCRACPDKVEPVQLGPNDHENMRNWSEEERQVLCRDSAVVIEGESVPESSIDTVWEVLQAGRGFTVIDKGGRRHEFPQEEGISELEFRDRHCDGLRIYIFVQTSEKTATISRREWPSRDLANVNCISKAVENGQRRGRAPVLFRT